MTPSNGAGIDGTDDSAPSPETATVYDLAAGFTLEDLDEEIESEAAELMEEMDDDETDEEGDA